MKTTSFLEMGWLMRNSSCGKEEVGMGLEALGASYDENR
jgi:hypothetical protein